MRLAFALSLFCGGAQAACLAGEQTFMACGIAGRGDRLGVCFDADTVFYRYGPADGPAELELSVGIESVAYTPWPGIGRAIWESVSFANADYTYEAFAGFDRMLADEANDGMDVAAFGGVHVLRNDEIIATRTCAGDSVAFGWDSALFEAKSALGQSWDIGNRQWLTLDD